MQDSPFVTEDPPDFRPPPPNEVPPPPPSSQGGIPRNVSWVGRPGTPSMESGGQSSLAVPEVKHARALSAPASPEYGQNRLRPVGFAFLSYLYCVS